MHYFSSLKSAILSTFFILFSGISTLVMANSTEVDTILQQEQAPEGVVFEVVSGDESYLATALEEFQTYQQQLKAKFPDIDLAIVSHGSEQFALTTNNQEKYADSHKLVKSILNSDVPVHVCGGHAKWRGLSDEDFPDYVDVSSSGPAQIRAYQELGYILVIL